MMMTDLDVFMPDILPNAPGCPEPTAFNGIRQAAIQFCERTKLWRNAESIDLPELAGQTIIAPTDAVILEIDEVRLNGAPIERKTQAWLDEHHPDWRFPVSDGTDSEDDCVQDGSNGGRYYTQTDLNTITLYPLAVGVLSVYICLKPTPDCDQVPAFLSDQWREVIAWGALARILMTPGQPFTDFQRGQMYAGQFNGRLDSLASKSTRGQQKAPSRARARFF